MSTTNRVVHKFQIKTINNWETIRLTTNAKLLHFDWQKPSIEGTTGLYLWAECDPDEETDKKVEVIALGTGIPGKLRETDKYFMTAKIRAEGDYIFHLYIREIESDAN